MTGIPTFLGHWGYGLAIAVLREQGQHGTWKFLEKLSYPEDYEDLVGYGAGFVLGYALRLLGWLLALPWVS